MSDLIMIIRHGEKALPDGSTLGVDRDGRANDDSLNVRGWERAGALVGFFAWPHLAGIAVPDHLYAPRPTTEDPSRRPLQTVEALGARLGRVVSTAYRKEDLAELVRELEQVEGPVLVSWEHKAIVKLANLLMHSRSQTPQRWPDDRFDVVWRFERASGGWQFSQLPQRLLAGDPVSIIEG